MSTPAPGPTGSAALVALRTLAGALVAAPVFITAALLFVLGGQDGALDPTPFLLVPVVLGAAAHLVCRVTGYGLTPVAPGTPREAAETHSRQQFSTRLTTRFVVCEVVLILCIAGAFVVPEGGALLVVVAAVVTVGLLAVHVWPTRAALARGQAALERDGARSYLFEAYGLPARPGGAVQEL